ncbi:MAG: sodium:solute symporter family protein [Acidobacteriota bacterium]
MLGRWDLVLLLIYGVTLFLPMLRFRRRGETSGDYFVAARRVTLPAFVASLVSTWYGGVLGVGEYTFKHGISNWIVFGIPYYLWAAVFALFMSREAHIRKHTSLPDLLNERYGRTAGLAGSVVLFVTTIPAVYSLELGLILSFVFGINLTWAILAGTLFTLAYVYYGGLRSVIDTDVIQFVLMFAGFAVMLPRLFLAYGGWGTLTSSLPAAHLTWHGGVEVQSVVVWYVIAASTLVEPAFYQRCYAARSAATARWGILASIGFWILFDFMTTFTGLYARALLPATESPTMSFPELGAKYLPPVLAGLFFVGMLSTVMSTLHGYLFIAGEILGRDIYCPSDDDPARRRARAGCLVAAGLSAGLAAYAKSIVRLWHNVGSITTAALLLPILLGYWSKRPIPGNRVTASIVAASCFTLLSIVFKDLNGAYIFGIEPIFPGLLISAMVLFIRRGGDAFAARR